MDDTLYPMVDTIFDQSAIDEITLEPSTEGFVDVVQKTIGIIKRMLKRLFEFMQEHANWLKVKAVLLENSIATIQDNIAGKSGLLNSSLTFEISKKTELFSINGRPVAKIMDLKRQLRGYMDLMDVVYKWTTTELSMLVSRIDGLLTHIDLNHIDYLKQELGKAIKDKGSPYLNRTLKFSSTGNSHLKTTIPYLGSVSLYIEESSKATDPNFALTRVYLSETETSTATPKTFAFTRFPMAMTGALLDDLKVICNKVKEVHSPRAIKARGQEYKTLVSKLERVGEALAEDANGGNVERASLEAILDQIKTVMVWGAKPYEGVSAHALRLVGAGVMLCKQNINGKVSTKVE